MPRRRRFAAGLLALAATSAAHTEPLTPGTVFRDCSACPEMVVIPPGTFTMGADGRYAYEGPAHAVTIEEPFAIGRFEVTFDEWHACVVAGGCSHQPHDHDWGGGRRPVINVSIAHVEAYLRWLSNETGITYRLPSEAEWAFANRGGTTTEFWWGDAVESGHANCRGCGSEWDGHTSAPVGSFPPNPFGLHDTTGNVLEWVEDCWNPDHTGARGDSSPRRDGDCRHRVIRGGSWYYVDKVARSAWRGKTDSRAGSYGIGLRVARDVSP